MNRPKNSLVSRLVVSFLGVSLMTALIVGFLSYERARTALESTVYDRLNRHREESEAFSIPIAEQTLDLYNDQDDETSVFTVVQGAGNIGYLAFDWFEDPAPAEWVEVLGLVVDAVQGRTKATSIPTLSEIGLLVLVLALLALGIAGMRRRIY